MLKRVLESFLIGVLILFQGCMSVPELHVFNGLVTNGGSGPTFEEVPMKAIHQKDTIYVVTHVRWEPVNSAAGEHIVTWSWHSGDKLAATRSMTFYFDDTPYRFWYKISAASFNVGHYRVDVAIDGHIVDTQEYDVVQ